MATGESAWWTNLGKGAQRLPSLGGESAFGKNVGNLLFGADMADEDAGVFAQAFEKEVEVDAVRAGHVLHLWTAAFDGHFDDRVIVFEDDKARLACVWCTVL